MLKEVPFSAFKRAYPYERDNLLMLLNIESFDEAILKICGIRSLKIFSIKGKLYYTYFINHEASHTRQNVSLGNRAIDKFYERYMLCIGACEFVEDDSYTEMYTLNYVLSIKDRKANVQLLSCEKDVLPPAYVSIFFYCIDRLFNIDAMGITVFIEDKFFVRELEKRGFAILEQEPNRYRAVKGNI